jgi:hypothetical protein
MWPVWRWAMLEDADVEVALEPRYARGDNQR